MQRLSRRVVCLLGQNPGPFTLKGTNTYLIGTGSSRILLDCGEGKPEYGCLLAETLSSEGCTIGQILVSHHHHDHVGGIVQIKTLCDRDVPVYKCPHTESPGHHVEACLPISDGQEFITEGATLRAVHTPGHTSDSMSFVLLEEGSVFVGDCILGTGSSVFSNLTHYLASLKHLRELAPSRLYCGHGPVVGALNDSEDSPASTDAVDKIDEYMRHRMEREATILAILESCHPEPVSAKTITEKIYPTEGVSGTLLLAAARSVLLHLLKLVDDDVITPVPTEVSETDEMPPDTNTLWKLVKDSK